MDTAVIGEKRILADQNARDRIRGDLDATLVIEAAAGTGKTTALVSRIVAVVASGRTTLDRIAAVTFTEKAAGELKLRLRGEIERGRNNDAEFDSASRQRLTAALEKLEEARIGTIHSFCADLLRERPVEAQVDPMFEVAPEEISGTLFDAAFERWFEKVLAAPGEGVRRVLRRRELADRDGPRPTLSAAARELKEWRDFDAPWRHHFFERERAIDELVAEILALDEIAHQAEERDWLRVSLQNLARPVREAIRLESVQPRDYDALEDTLLRLLRGRQRHWEWKGKGIVFGAITRSEAFARRQALHDRLLDFRRQAGANLAPILRDEIWPVVTIYDEMKARAGRLDFLDLLLTARDLVRNNAAVRRELQDRFTHIFIDEFQDTDPLQAEILLLLASDDPDENDWLKVQPKPGKLFIVGDPKQSIYRFRRADVALYQLVKRRLLESGAALERLTVSFRAVPEIQRMVNAAFAPLLEVESESQPLYAALEPFRPGYSSQPAVVVLPIPAPYSSYGRIAQWSIEESLPDAVAAFIRWMVEESGWTVTERDAPDKRVPVRPRHICILFRRLYSFRRDVTRQYVRALEARHIPHVLVRGSSFNQREEVEALRNALAAIERPEDQLCVYATLRGPLFALSDGALLRMRERFRTLHPFVPMPGDLPSELQEVADAMNVLRELHRGRNRRPISDTISRLLTATRAHAGIAIWPTGEQALANVMRLMEMARRYESSGAATSFRGFVDLLEDRAASEQAGDTPVVEEGTEGVRIMSVHSAKGLEFPIVLLADITCRETREPGRYVDPERRLCAQRLAGCEPPELVEHADEEKRRDEEEAIRVLYVAATRARDLMVIPAVGDERHEGWLARLNPAIYPLRDDALAPVTRKPAGCPPFNSEYVGERPPDVSVHGGVAPGMHRAEAGGHDIVWWDPATLVLSASDTMGLRQFNLLQADERHERSDRGQREYEDWKVAREKMIQAGQPPSIRTAIATELATQSKAGHFGELGPIGLVKLERAGSRPHGARFGTLVHATLARAALDASPAEVAGIAAFFGRILGASDEEVAAAGATAADALASGFIREAAQSKKIYRESPLAVVLDDGQIAEGVADLVFRENTTSGPQWVVVDFKTDIEIASRLHEYRVQLSLYIRAISRATGVSARGVILWI